MHRVLLFLDPENKPPDYETQCPTHQGQDAKQLAEYLATLACSVEAATLCYDLFAEKVCSAAAAAPYVARGLIRNGRIEAAGVEIATIAGQLREGPCPGVKGFTEDDWAQLDQLVERVQKSAAKPSAPSQGGARPDVPGAP